MTADLFRVVEPGFGLHGGPDTVRITSSRARGNRGNNVGIHGLCEIDDTLPLRARKDAIKAFRRTLQRRIIVVLEIGGVAPGAADADVGWTERGGEFAEFRVRKIDRRSVLEEAAIETCRLVSGMRIGAT